MASAVAAVLSLLMAACAKEVSRRAVSATRRCDPADATAGTCKAEAKEEWPADIAERVRRGDADAWAWLVERLGIATGPHAPLFQARLFRLAVAAGPSATPVVDRLIELARAEGEYRLDAVQTLGQVLAIRSAGALETALESYSWEVAGYAALAIARLRPDKVPRALERAAKEHPLPSVRALATASIAAIREGRGEISEARPLGLYNDIVHSEAEMWFCEVPMPPAVATATVVVNDRKKSPPTPAPLRKVGPSTFLPIEGGWLVGNDRGEYGGALFFVDSDSDTAVEQLLPANILYIARLAPDEFRVVTGLAHLDLDDGWVWRLSRRGKHFRIERLVQLPSCPQDIREHAGGVLSAATSIGRVLIGPEGVRRAEPCQLIDMHIARIVQAALHHPPLARLAAEHAPNSTLVLACNSLLRAGLPIWFRGEQTKIEGDRPADKHADELSIAVNFSPRLGRAYLAFSFGIAGPRGGIEVERRSDGWSFGALRLE